MRILHKLHPRQVIWLLLVALFALIAFVGKHYDNRLEALENHKKEQNGHLRNIAIDMEVMKTNIYWIRGELERRP